MPDAERTLLFNERRHLGAVIVPLVLMACLNYSLTGIISMKLSSCINEIKMKAKHRSNKCQHNILMVTRLLSDPKAGVILQQIMIENY